jgi:hypothetical protein
MKSVHCFGLSLWSNCADAYSYGELFIVDDFGRAVKLPRSSGLDFFVDSVER